MGSYVEAARAAVATEIDLPLSLIHIPEPTKPTYHSNSASCLKKKYRERDYNYEAVKILIFVDEVIQ